MPSKINISFNMHPRWVTKSQLSGFLSPLREAGVDTLEFELDRHLADWPAFPDLMEACFNLGLNLCFHAPYRVPNGIAGFSSSHRDGILENYQPMLAIAQRWADRSGKLLNVVVHGAKSLESEIASLKADTLQFLSWCLAEFPGLRIAFEIAGPAEPGDIKIGGDRAGIWEVISAFDNARLGICWDMGHDHLNGASALPDLEWLKKVIHVHVHDVDEKGIDHYPLVFGRVPYPDWLPALKQVGMEGIVTLEIKGGLLRDWPIDKINAALIDSFTSIRRLTT
jgi:sugar phosphate isomerase/epimerase